MIKKALVAAIAAGALSVPLAAAAWAEPPSDPSSNDNPIGAGGVPEKLGNFLDTGITPGENPSGGPITPGSVIGGLAKLPGSTPDAMGQFEAGLWATHTLTNGDPIQTVWGSTPPGLASIH